jgi:hypothetical protein
MVASVGCSDSERVEVFPVRGRVNFEGKPLMGGGAISFMPLASQKGRNAGGIINPDGTFVMTTYVEGDGAMAGQFRVMINQTTMQEPDFQGDSDTPDAARAIKAVQTVTAKDVIPTIYADPVQSPIEVTIDAKESNELTIDLIRNVPGSFVPGA